MAAYSLHLGLNRVNPGHYNGWSGVLQSCEQDAKDMALMLSRQGFRASVLLTAQATAGRLLTLLGDHAASLQAGDCMVITFAGHGSQVRDADADEPDRLDETWLLFDRMVIDDEIRLALARFRPGVRVAVVSDSCHSGTVLRALAWNAPSSRLMPAGLAEAVIAANAAAYASIRAGVPRLSSSYVRCDALLLAACQDSQVAADGPANGLFTATLKQVWSAGRFRGTYVDLMRAVLQRMPPHQRPSLLGLGNRFREFALEPAFAPRAAASTPVPGR
jgi:metacaspase-1